MADNYNVPNVTVDANTPDEPSPGLVNFANNLGINEDQLKTVYTGLKQSNPDLPDAKIALALKYYSQQPQQQVQTNMNKQQDVANAMPSVDQIKQTYDPTIGQKYADFQKANQGNQVLSGNLAAQSDLARQRAGGSPIAVQQNNDYWKTQADNITKPAELAQGALKGQQEQLDALRKSFQDQIKNVGSNVELQNSIASYDATSPYSKPYQDFIVKNWGIPAAQAQNMSAAMIRDLFGKEGAGTIARGLEIQAKNAQSEATTAGAAATNAKTNAGRFKMQQDVMNGPGGGDYAISGDGIELSPRAKSTQEGDFKEFQDVRSQQPDLNNVQQHIDDAVSRLQRINYTGPLANLIAKATPNSELAKLGTDLQAIGVDYTKAFAKDAGARAGGNVAIETKEADSVGNLGQGKQTLLNSLNRLRNSVGQKRAYNDQLMGTYGKDKSLSNFSFAPPNQGANGGAAAGGGANVRKYNPQTRSFE